MIPKNVLITGASGLIGSRLTQLLQARGYTVSHMGRTARAGSVKSYVWNVEAGTLDPEALRHANAVIHLAGAGIADKRWTPARKQEIIDSRVESTALLNNALRDPASTVKTVVMASAIGYYGFGFSEEVFTEASKPGTDFLAGVVKDWEAEADKIDPSVRLVKMRVGIVLSEKGGALKEMLKPVQWYVGAPLGTGKQYMSWIHIDDLCYMFIHALENDSMHGAYNATGISPVTNRELTSAIGRAINKPVWLPPVPAVVLKAFLGEMANLVLYGSKVSSQRIQDAGFQFQFPLLDAALQNLLKK